MQLAGGAEMRAAGRLWRSAILAGSVITACVMGLGVPAAGASVVASSGGSTRASGATGPLPGVVADGRLALSSAAGNVKPGASIGTVGAPLLGGVRYTGTAATQSGEAWYQLDKTGTATATIHVKDTTVPGSTSCPSIQAYLDNAAGTSGVVNSTGLNDNGTVNFPVTTAGLYYIEIIGWNCTPTTATTYSIEPETASAWTTPTPPAAGTTKAGPSIGTVGAPLRGQKLYSGTAATSSGEAWYQLDKKGNTTAIVRVEDTVISGSTSCGSIQAYLDNAAGTSGVVNSTGLNDNGAVNFPVTTAGLYYIEIIGWNCTPTTATTYSVEPETASAWTTPTPPAAGTTKAGSSIGTVGAPLRGQKLYTGTAATRSSQAWYQLDKTGTATAIVRVEDTVISGSTGCGSIQAYLDNAAGTSGVVNSTGLNDNGAVNFPVTTAGLYYIEIIGWNCTPTTATTYSVEPETASAWTTPTPPAAGTTKAGTSMATVGPPLLGDTLYKGTAATSSGEAWYQLDKTGTATATIRVEDTVISGSTSCPSIQAYLDNGTGGVVNSTGLNDNGAVNFPVTTAGLYYIEIVGWNCTPTTATTYSVEPEPAAAWTTVP